MTPGSRVESTNKQTIRTYLEKWMTYGEYLEVEFDVAANTATVVPRH